MLMNRWPLRRLALTVVSLQSTVFGLLIMAGLGMPLEPLLTPVVLVYVLVIPGCLVLRSLKVRELGLAESIPLTIGLSLVIFMGVGLLLNEVGPLVGLAKPLQQSTLLAAVTVFDLALLFVCSLRGSPQPQPPSPMEPTPIPPLLFAAILPLVGITGAIVLDSTGSSTLVEILFVAVCTVPILIVLNWLPSKEYPVALFAASLALLYHRSMVSPFTAGYDVQWEYYFSSLSVKNGIWLPAIESNVNAVLPATILIPGLSVASGADLVWTFKVVLPILYSLVPVVLYSVFATQISKKTSVLSAFLIMSTFIYFQVMNDLPRQQIAELFLVLALLLLVKPKPALTSQRLMLLAFSLGLIVSHYGLSYVFLFLLLAALTHRSMTYRSRDPAESPPTPHFGLGFVAFYLVSIFAWYMNVSGASVFVDVVGLVNFVAANIVDLFAASTQPIGTFTGQEAPLHQLTKGLFVVLSVLIVVGYARTKHDLEGRGFRPVYMALAFGTLLLLGFITIVPFVAASLNFNRFYGIALLILAPFSVLGSRSLLEKLRAIRPDLDATKWFAVFLVLFLLFNSGVIYELAGEQPLSMSVDANVDFARFVPGEVAGATWLQQAGMTPQGIYTDGYRAALFVSIFGEIPRPLAANLVLTGSQSCIALMSENLDNGWILTFDATSSGQAPVHIPLASTNIPTLISGMNRTFDDGYAHADCRLG